MSQLRAAILGYGRNGSTMHAGGIEGNPNLQMSAVCDIDPARRAQAQARFGCPVYENYHEMLQKEALDFVAIVTRSAQHCQMTCDCLRAGANVLVTKPWAVNAAEARQMIGTAAETGRQLLPWLPARWSPDLQRLKRLATEKEIGTIFMIRRSVTCWAIRNDWQIEKRHGGGYLLNWGPHIIEPPILLADSKVKTIYAQMRQVINPGDTEDVFTALMTLENGTIILAEHVIAAEEMPDWFIQGDSGTCVIRGRNLTLYKNTPKRPDDPTQYGDMVSKKEKMVEETLVGNPYGDTNEVYLDIAAALTSKKKYPVAPSDALELSEIMDGIRRSSEEDRVVSFH
ncbi:Gfo/Idh/MocA family oxidoreductase [candidate division KSB1 bacterium]|nr:Gfo/Idh/MocA family oxidoreductase [candidate division KSB1 bacterium]